MRIVRLAPSGALLSPGLLVVEPGSRLIFCMDANPTVEFVSTQCDCLIGSGFSAVGCWVAAAAQPRKVRAGSCAVQASCEEQKQSRCALPPAFGKLHRLLMRRS